MHAPPCPPCPNCREAVKVGYTVKSDLGSYCRCQTCGNVWHVDFFALLNIGRRPTPTYHE